jgi:hypothetical protein
MQMWEAYLQADGAKRLIRMEDVAEVRDSPTRLAARFANELYQQGESGMGYTVFTIVFSDGARQACVTSNSVDFIQYPPGKGSLDVVAVIPHDGRKDESLVKAPPSYWHTGASTQKSRIEPPGFSQHARSARETAGNRQTNILSS